MYAVYQGNYQLSDPMPIDNAMKCRDRWKQDFANLEIRPCSYHKSSRLMTARGAINKYRNKHRRKKAGV